MHFLNSKKAEKTPSQKLFLQDFNSFCKNAYGNCVTCKTVGKVSVIDKGFLARYTCIVIETAHPCNLQAFRESFKAYLLKTSISIALN